MNLFGVLDVSGSALKAERVRAEVVAANMANAETTRTVDGGPYRRQQVVFQAANAGSEQNFAASLLGQGGFGEIGAGAMSGLHRVGRLGEGTGAEPVSGPDGWSGSGPGMGAGIHSVDDLGGGSVAGAGFGSIGSGGMGGLRRVAPFAALGSTAADAEAGVQVSGIVSDQSAPLQRYDPQHPDSGPDGYVAYPDINPLTEMVDLMGAQRSYGMNTSAITAEKGMIVASLEIGK